jgi:hypothetical protein
MVLPPIPPTPMQAVCSMELGEAERRMAGKPKAAAAAWGRKWRRFMVSADKTQTPD